MTYIELQSFKKLLAKYIKDVVIYDKQCIMYKMSNDVMENLAIMVNRYLDEGNSFEKIIETRLLLKLNKEIDLANIKTFHNGKFIKLSEIKQLVNISNIK